MSEDKDARIVELEQQVEAMQQEVSKLQEMYKAQAFLSNQMQYNGVMYQGYKIILDKLTKIEGILEKQNEQTQTKTSN